jgi:amino acid transporter
VAIASVVILALVNSRGARAAGGLSVVTVLIKILPLFAVIVAAAQRTATSTAPGRLASSIHRAGRRSFSAIAAS